MKLNRIPLFLQVAEKLRQEIQTLSPGAKLETDQGLARRFGVSVSVVREALSIFSREGLVYRRVGRGTFVATPPAKPAKPVAILCDLDLTQLASPRHMVRRIQESKRVLEMQGLDTRIYLGDHVPSENPPPQLTCRQFLKDLATIKFGGVLAVWGFPQDSWMEELKCQKVPLVGFGLLHENMVSYDFEAYVRLGLESLKARGRRKIAYLSGQGEWNLGGHDQERRNLVMRLFQEAGIEVREGWFCQEWHHSQDGVGWTSFREIWTRYAERPDGLIIGNPRLWPDTEKALHSLNLQVSKDLDVVAPNAISAHQLRTTPTIHITFDSNALIVEAVDLLLQLMRGDAPSNTRRLVNAWNVAGTVSPSPTSFSSDQAIDPKEELLLLE